MVLKKADRAALMKITSDLHENPTLVMDLLPRLSQVLMPSDITRIEYRGNIDGWEWAANDLLMFYQMRARDLHPIIEALKACKMCELAQKISKASLASAEVSVYSDGEVFKRVLSEIRSYVRGKYLGTYAKLRPLPQICRVFDINKIWVNLQLENRTQLKDPEDYRACMLSAFEENRLLIITGHQGSGKTTLVRRIAFDWASGNLDKFDLVLTARYNDLENDAETAMDLALQWMRDKQFLTPEHTIFLQQHKNKVRLLLLLDGLDQSTIKCATIDKALRSEVFTQFDYFVLLTSRPQTVNETVQCPSPIAFILPWNEKALVEYIMMHFLQYTKEGGLADFAPHEKAQKNTHAVLDFLASHPNVDKLASVPLHITFICLLQEDGALEPGMSSSLLHRKLCHALVRRQVALSNAPLYPELLKEFQTEFGAATRCDVMRNLALLAYDSLVKGIGFKRIFSYKDLKEKDVDIEIWLKVGFLQTSDEGQGAKYEFPHVSLQYYLVADLLLGEFKRVEQLEIIEKEKDLKISNQEVIIENPILREFWWSTKIEKLEPLVCYLIEMALGDGEKSVNSIAAFLCTCDFRYIGADIYTVELLLRLANQCNGAAKITTNALVAAAVFTSNHSAKSLIAIAGNVPVVRVHECGILFQDINTVVFSSKPIHAIQSADFGEVISEGTTITLCLLDEGTLEFLAQTCRRMGWKEIFQIRAVFGHNSSKFQTSSLPTDYVVNMTEVDLDFKHPVHSINATPVLQQLLSLATIRRLMLRNASIGDLSTAFSDQRLVDSIETIILERVSFPNDDDLSQFGMTLSSFQCLTNFHLSVCRLSGSQLIDFLLKLKSSSTCHNLRLAAMACIQENRTFTQFCSLLSDWSNMQMLGLDNNNLSSMQIDQLIQATTSLRLTRLNLGGIPNLREEHVAAFQCSNPFLSITTGYTYLPQVKDWGLLADPDDPTHSDENDPKVALGQDTDTTQEVAAELINHLQSRVDVSPPFPEHIVMRNAEISEISEYKECFVHSFASKSIVVCSGAKGSGKTTLLQSLLKAWSDGCLQDYDIVLSADLNGSQEQGPYAEIFDLALAHLPKKSFKDMLKSRLPIMTGCPSHHFKSQKLSFHVLIALDGVTDQSIHVCKQLSELLSSHISHTLPFALLLLLDPRYKALVQCPAVFVDLMPLSTIQQDQVINNMLDETLAVSFKNVLDRDDREEKMNTMLRSACGNPGFLKSLCQNSNVLACLRSTSLEKITKEHIFYSWWQMLKELSIPDQFDTRLASFLGKAALQMVLEDRDLSKPLEFSSFPIIDGGDELLNLSLELGLLTEDHRFNVTKARTIRTLQFSNVLLALFMASFYVSMNLRPEKGLMLGLAGLIEIEFPKVVKSTDRPINEILSSQNLMAIEQSAKILRDLMQTAS